MSQTDILKYVWPDSVVTPNLVKDYIATIRKALGDSADKPVFVETKRHLGYRFIGKIEKTGDSTLASTLLPLDENHWDPRFCDLMIEKSIVSMEMRTSSGYGDALSRLQLARTMGCCQRRVSHALARLHLIAHVCALDTDRDDHLERALVNASLAYGLGMRNADIAATFASALTYSREYKVAKIVFERSLELDPKSSRVLELYGNYLSQIGEHSSSERVLSKSDVSTLPSIKWMRACNLFQLGNYQAALDILVEHINDFPQTTRPLHGYAAILAMLGDKGKSERIIQRLSEVNSTISLENEYTYQASYYRRDEDAQRWVKGVSIAGLR